MGQQRPVLAGWGTSGVRQLGPHGAGMGSGQQSKEVLIDFELSVIKDGQVEPNQLQVEPSFPNSPNTVLAAYSLCNESGIADTALDYPKRRAG